MFLRDREPSLVPVFTWGSPTFFCRGVVGVLRDLAVRIVRLVGVRGSLRAPDCGVAWGSSYTVLAFGGLVGVRLVPVSRCLELGECATSFRFALAGDCKLNCSIRRATTAAAASDGARNTDDGRERSRARRRTLISDERGCLKNGWAKPAAHDSSLSLGFGRNMETSSCLNSVESVCGPKNSPLRVLFLWGGGKG